MHHFRLLKLPDLITYLGFFSAVASTFLILEKYFLLAYIFIIAQLIADFFDGKVARMIKRNDQLGVHLDSFADFYVIINCMLFGIFMGINHISMYTILPIFLAAAMLRLSNFAISVTQGEKGYTGLPTTLSSFIISTLLILNHLFFYQNINYSLSIYLLLAILMVSNIKLKKS